MEKENTAAESDGYTDDDTKTANEFYENLEEYKRSRIRRTTVSNGIIEPVEDVNTNVVQMNDIQKSNADWLIPGYIPKGQITAISGEGGVGKTSVWCNIVAAVSSGNPCLLEHDMPEQWIKREPQKVLIFSSEDSLSVVLKQKLISNGACEENISSIPIYDERFKLIKLNSEFLRQLIERYKPALCVFDPIQAFVPPNIRMGDRNAMRNCLDPLMGYGEKFGTSFILIVHANKQSGVWGRKRMADSSDVWDASRSVLMLGETREKDIRYISHEKNNYGRTEDTILYSINNDGIVEYKGHSKKKDKEFIREEYYEKNKAPVREEAKKAILDILEDGRQHEVEELKKDMNALGFTFNAYKVACSDLKNEKVIKLFNLGYGKDKKYFISLKDPVENL